MFEGKTKEYCQRKEIKLFGVNRSQKEVEIIGKAFFDGCVTGYNTAKEECTGIVTKRIGELADRIGWHYPSKGELPPSGQDVLIHNRKKYLIDRYYSDGDEWLYTKNEDVVAWYYLPELVKP